MEEQQHRRRRPQRSEGLSNPEMTAEPQQSAPPQESNQSTHEDPAGAPHHRRRRGAAHRSAQEEIPAQQEEIPAQDTLKDEQAQSPADNPAAEAEGNEPIFWQPQIEPPKQQPAKPRLLELLLAADGWVCRIGDACLDLIAKAAVLMARAAVLLWKGAKRLAAKTLPVLRRTGKKMALRSGIHRGKRIRSARPASGGEAEVTLKAIRPEEYRGMGVKRGKRVVRAPRKRSGMAYPVMMSALLCVAVFSAYMVGSIVWRSVSTKRLNDSLSQRYTELSDASNSADEQKIALQEPDSSETESAQQAAEEEIPQEILLAQTPGAVSPQATMHAPEPEEEHDGEAEKAAPKTTPVKDKKQVVRTTKFHQVGGDALPEMEALYKENRDLVGWLRMEGILDLPVVYKDNDYYLKRDFYKNKSDAGTLFLDENHPFRENAQNLLLHGHNMKDGTMFGRLVQYETNLQFLRNNPFIQYSTLWNKEQYVIFAVLHVSLNAGSSDFFNYFTHHTFSSDMEFENYVRSLQTRSVFSIPVDVEPSDALLTLSTCLDEDRLVIVARRVREGESKSDLRHLVQLAARQ